MRRLPAPPATSSAAATSISQSSLRVAPTSTASIEELAAVGDLLQPENLIGCCAQGVVGPGHEIEQGAGATVWAAALPDAHVESFHLVASPIDEGIAIEGMPGFGGPAEPMDRTWRSC